MTNPGSAGGEPTTVPPVDTPGYLTSQLVTYLGNKRALLGPIGRAVAHVKQRLGRDRLRVLDAFSGSGVVSRYLKAHASFIASNDIEDYAGVIGRCYLRNRSTVNLGALSLAVTDLNARVAARQWPRGFIEELYLPARRVEHHGRRSRRLHDGQRPASR